MLLESENLYQTLLAYQRKEAGFEKAVTSVQKIYSQSGVWYCTIRAQVALGLLVTNSYPVSGAMRLLRKIEGQVKSKISPLNAKELLTMEPNIREVVTLINLGAQRVR
jgi:hypothetical protein